MKKYIVGFIAGLLMATTFSVGASTISKVGKTIQSEVIVTLDGEQIGTGIVIDDTSYAPIRVVSESAGLNVGYQKGTVILETKKPHNIGFYTAEITRLTEYKKDVENFIERKEAVIVNSQARIDAVKEKIENSEFPDAVKSLEEQVSVMEEGHLKLELELQDYKNKLIEIESDLIEMQTELNKLESTK